MKTLLALALAASLAGCALPVTQVQTGAVRPTLAVQGAPADADLYVDGLLVGNAAAYQGVAQKLFIEEGTHQVEIRRAGAVLMSQKVFAANGENSNIVFRAEAKQ